MGNTLIGKIAAASIKVGALATDKVNASQNYAYISADKILDRAGNALAEGGIVVLPSITKEVVQEINYTDNYGKARIRHDATVIFEMLISDGESELRAGWVGRGSDFAVPDKALYKAITSGHKYFLAKLLNIGVGNEDSEHEVEATPSAANAQHPEGSRPRTSQEPAAQHRGADMGDATFSREGQGEKPPVAKGKVTEIASEAQIRRLHAVGVELYGKKEWDVQRPKLVQAVTTGAVTSSKELSPQEATKLISGIEKKIAQVAAMQQSTGKKLAV